MMIRIYSYLQIRILFVNKIILKYMQETSIFITDININDVSYVNSFDDIFLYDCSNCGIDYEECFQSNSLTSYSSYYDLENCNSHTFLGKNILLFFEYIYENYHELNSYCVFFNNKQDIHYNEGYVSQTEYLLNRTDATQLDFSPIHSITEIYNDTNVDCSNIIDLFSRLLDEDTTDITEPYWRKQTMFIVSKKCILSRELSFYANIIDILSYQFTILNNEVNRSDIGTVYACSRLTYILCKNIFNNTFLKTHDSTYRENLILLYNRNIGKLQGYENKIIFREDDISFISSLGIIEPTAKIIYIHNDGMLGSLICIIKGDFNFDIPDYESESEQADDSDSESEQADDSESIIEFNCHHPIIGSTPNYY